MNANASPSPRGLSFSALRSIPVAAVCMAAVIALVSGCAAEAPAPVLLSLPPHLPAAAATAPAAFDARATKVLLLRRVVLPEYLSSRRVRYRAEGATLVEWPNAVWAERIEIGVTRELAAALRDALPGWTVCEASCPEALGSPVTLQVSAAPLDYRRSARRTEGRLRAELSGPAITPVVVERPLDVPAGADTPQAQAESLAVWLQAAAAAIAPTVQAARP